MITASGGVSLSYDPAGRLNQVTGAATTRFLYDGADAIAEYNTSGTVLRRFVHGPGADEPLLWYEGSGTTDKRYLIADERGSVIGVTNGTGSVTTVNRYDAAGIPGASNAGRFQYTGQMWLADVGLYRYKARAYHPRLGRFLQTDPIGTAGGMNLYGYVGNDAVNFRDPLGLQKEGLDEMIVSQIGGDSDCRRARTFLGVSNERDEARIHCACRISRELFRAQQTGAIFRECRADRRGAIPPGYDQFVGTKWTEP